MTDQVPAAEGSASSEPAAQPTTAELTAILFPEETPEGAPEGTPEAPPEAQAAPEPKVDDPAPVPAETPQDAATARLVKRETEIQAQRKALEAERVAWREEQANAKKAAKEELLARLKDPYT
ncbi:MAG: hypothetical protein ACREJF_00310, partial [Candidatus Methylomirabilales bacterium]